MGEQVDPAAVVLAAGSGSRLRPLTDLRPKALCPVNNVALVDHAITAVQTVTSSVAVNIWHHAGQLVDHLDGRVRLSVEDIPLGTAGALGELRDWIDGRPVLVHNGDAWHKSDIRQFTEGWDGERVRLLVEAGADLADLATSGFCGVSLMPWSLVKTFEAEPSGLWELSWAQLWERDQLDIVRYDGAFFDCGTASSYLAANLAASGGESVVGEGADIRGSIDRCVVWPGARVDANEHLVEAIRVSGGVTVDARSPAAVSK